MQLQRALVTGASAGIGRAIAIDLATRGTDLVLVARDESRLQELADELTAAHAVDVEVLPADLTLAADRERVEQRVADLPAVDCLVNNAGWGPYGPMAASDVATEADCVELNVTALTRLTQVAAQTFGLRRHGAILNVSSLAGFQPNPGHATYGATKAFVTSLTEAVHEELRDTGVHVTALCPGYTRTEFHDRADWRIGGLPAAVWGRAEDVAREGVDGVLANRAVVIPGVPNKVAGNLSRVLPSGVTRKVTRALVAQGGRT
jgi:short-subunit dehydrogenase